MRRKTNSNAFEEAHPKAARAVEQWMFEAEPKLDCKAAAARLQAEFKLDYSPEALRRFWHRSAQERLLLKIADRARQAQAVGQALRKNPAQTFEALMGLIEQAAFDQSMNAGDPLTLIQLTELTKLAIAGKREILHGEELAFDREKFKEALRTKTDVALDAFAEFLKGQPKLLEEFDALRAKVKAVMS